MYAAKSFLMGIITLLVIGKLTYLPGGNAEALQGAWEIVSVTRSGTRDKGPDGQTLTFVGDEVRLETSGDASLSPVRFEYVRFARLRVPS